MISKGIEAVVFKDNIYLKVTTYNNFTGKKTWVKEEKG